MRALVAVLLFAGHRNPFQYVEPPPKKVIVKKQEVAATVIAPEIVVPPKEEVKLPPQPPAFPYRCIGRFGPSGDPFAVFDAGGAIINVKVGQLIDGKFIVRDIGLESVTIGVDGFPDARQRVLIGSER